MQLYGREWTRREVEARVGRLEQIGGIRRFRLVEGAEDGVEQIEVRTGAGLTYIVTPARGLDISLAKFGDVPLSWQSSSGDVHPAYFDPTGTEWLRTAAGGLLMTCGLTQAAGACEDEGVELGLHGRAHHLPARHVVAEGHWQGDEYQVRVGGFIEETAIFGDHMRLSREIRSRLGENRIVIRDVVENLGFETTPHMLLYHFNFGFPLLGEDTRLVFPSARVVPYKPEIPLAGFDQWQAPERGYEERVYYHEDLATVKDTTTQEEKATVLIENPRFPLDSEGNTRDLAVSLTWSTKNLPRLLEWKMPGMGVHALGVEPANCLAGGRAAERESGTLVMLEPGESLTYDLELALDVQVAEAGGH